MMTRKNYSSKKGGRKTNKRYYNKKRGGFNWSSLNPFAKKTENDTNVSSSNAPTASSTAPTASSTAPAAPAPTPTCPPCPVCQQPVPPAVAEAIKEQEPSSAPPALESQLGGGKKRKTRRNRTKKGKKSKKLWFQIGCVKV
jgi:hypothetical protein